MKSFSLLEAWRCVGVLWLFLCGYTFVPVPKHPVRGALVEGFGSFLMGLSVIATLLVLAWDIASG